MAGIPRTRLVPRLRAPYRDAHDTSYRPALDGVRAVAVLAVIAYHVGWRVPGGFLGVDVFFVLSGYLITGLLLREASGSSRIRLSEFWIRRARRLLPAALLLLVVCAIVAKETAPLATLPDRRADILSTLFYYGNWHFIESAQSYFTTYTGVSPLRHTWSLAIEEQFYLLWPLFLAGFMFLVRGWRRALPWLIVGGAAISTVLMAVRYNAANPIRSYYGTDTRVHELLIGAGLAALMQLRPDFSRSGRARHVARRVAPIAATIVVVSFFTVSDQDAFYYRGGSAFFAIVVAAGLWSIEMRPEKAVASALSRSPMRWIGRVSYGLYLWHWPLIVWLGESERFKRWDPLQLQLLEVAATFAIATASFYLLECPIRYGTLPWLRHHARRFVALASVGVAIPAFLAVQSTQIRFSVAQGQPKIDAAQVAEQLNDKSIVECAPSPFLGDLYGFCEKTTPWDLDPVVVAIAGDSTSLALYPGMFTEASEHGWRYIQAGENGCSATPLLFVGSTDPAEIATKVNCPKLVPEMLKQVADAYDPDVWIINDWVASASLMLDDGRLLGGSDPERVSIVAAAMRTQLEQLTAYGAQVVYIKSLPVGEPVDCITDRAPATCGDKLHSVDDAAIKTLDKAVRKATNDLSDVAYVSIDDILCPDDGHCPPVIDGALARYDGVHFTATFSNKIVPIIISRAEEAGISFTHRA